MIVPSGYYDRVKGSWLGSDNGKVIRVLASTNGLANVDTNGDGAADDSVTLTALGIDDSERRVLATLYSASQSLWRIPVSHFTPWDFNLSIAPPPQATPPMQPRPDGPVNVPGSCQIPFRSTVDCQNQTLGEEIAIAGTPFSLVYDSGRLNRGQFTMEVNVSGTLVPPPLKRIELTIGIAGQTFRTSYAAQPNLKYSFTWNGRDAYGRVVQGTRDATVTLGYVYGSVYVEPAQTKQAWATTTGVPVTGSSDRSEITFLQSWAVPLGQLNVQPTGFGG